MKTTPAQRKKQLTEIQTVTFRRVLAAHPAWYRAIGNGERVTLVYLYRSGVLVRRARRGNDGEADAAYEYRLSSDMLTALGAGE